MNGFVGLIVIACGAGELRRVDKGDVEDVERLGFKEVF